MEEIIVYDPDTNSPTPLSGKPNLIPKRKGCGRKIGGRVSEAQQKALIKYMTDHPELRKGKFTPNFTHKIAMNLWEQAAVELNAIPGANKDPQQWRRCWHDIKKSTRCKASRERKYQGGTGGGPPRSILTENEVAVSQLLSEVEMRGNPYIEEEGLTLEHPKGAPVTEDSQNTEIIYSSKEIVDVEVTNSTFDIFNPPIGTSKKKLNDEEFKENMLRAAEDQVRATERTNDILAKLVDVMKKHNDHMEMFIEILSKK